MKIKNATPEMFDEMIELGAKMHAEGRYSFLPYDREKLSRMANALYAMKRGILLTVEGDDGKIIAMAIMVLETYYFCDEILATDLLIYVEPSSRGGMAAVMMLREIDVWAKANNAREVKLGVSNGGDADRIGKFYERMGYAHIGGIYKKGL